MARTDATKLRIALAQVNPTVGDIEANLAKISQLYAASEAAGCDIVMFPELSITGYPPEDLVLKAGFVAANQEAMGNFARTTGTCVAVVGFVDGSTDLELYNAAAVISGGVVHDVYRKQLLPNYSVFDEQRYFTPGDSFSLYQIGGVHVGVTICEDIWDASGPVRQQAQAGAAINININGSPYHRGKIGERAAMIGERAKDNHCAIAYVNQVCGQDELVFDGGSMVFDHTGTLVARSPQFVEDLLIVDIDVASPKLRRGTRVVAISSAPRNKPSDLQAVITKEETDLEQVFGALVLGTRDYVRKNGFTDVVIGLSGGIDSALVAAIAVEALGAQHVHGVSMPSRYSSEGSRTDAAALATALGIDLQTISIEPAFEAYLSMTQQSFAGKAARLNGRELTKPGAWNNAHGPIQQIWLDGVDNRQQERVGGWLLHVVRRFGWRLCRDQRLAQDHRVRPLSPHQQAKRTRDYFRSGNHETTVCRTAARSKRRPVASRVRSVRSDFGTVCGTRPNGRRNYCNGF